MRPLDLYKAAGFHSTLFLGRFFTHGPNNAKVARPTVAAARGETFVPVVAESARDTQA